ncbi:nucleotide exchange factor sil1 [Tieghemiomyces parasiticus]|uniref:Nucleotide exchange factor SIL1 n=1 Tax=Tieghemiomyces parasiticus TaxID=78921 RepID=A0A9W8A8J4_9FUNG|nr:nucleotide exchange factor sil1 [Tieghemiomyces parasiticus]
MGVALLVGGYFLWSTMSILRTANRVQPPVLPPNTPLAPLPIPERQPASPPAVPVSPARDICQLIDGREVCGPRKFVATHDFQPILDGQVVPEGLHYKLDMASGHKWAKLLDDKPDDPHAVAVVVTPGEVASAPVTTKTKPEIAPPPPTKPNGRLGIEERAQFEVHMQDILRSAGTSAPTAPADLFTLILTLGDLADLVEEREFGEHFVDQNGIPALLALMDRERSVEVTQQAALVLGNALQSNPRAQHTALNFGLMDKLFTRIGRETSPAALNRLVYALASLVRGSPEAVAQFANHASGIHTLAQVYAATADILLRRRCVRLISDVFNPLMVPTPVRILDNAGTRADVHHWCWNFGRGLRAAITDPNELDVDWKSTLAGGLLNAHLAFPQSCALTCNGSYRDLAGAAIGGNEPCPFDNLQPALEDEVDKYADDEDYSTYADTLRKLLATRKA